MAPDEQPNSEGQEHQERRKVSRQATAADSEAVQIESVEEDVVAEERERKKRRRSWARHMVVDTITTRFMMLFIIVLVVPLISLAWFTANLFRSYMYDEIHNELQATQDLLQAYRTQQDQELEVILTQTIVSSRLNQGSGHMEQVSQKLLTRCQKLGGGVCIVVDLAHQQMKALDFGKPGLTSVSTTDHGEFDQAIRRYGLSNKPFLLEWNGELVQFLAQPVYELDNLPPTSAQQRFLVVGRPLDDVWLRGFYRLNPTLRSAIWIVDEEKRQKGDWRLFLQGGWQDGEAVNESILKGMILGSGRPRASGEPGEDLYQVNQQILYDGLNHPVARLALIMSIEPLQKGINYYYAGFYLILSVGLILSVLIALWVSRMINRPLFVLIDQVNALSKAEDMGEHEVSVEGFYEINELVQSFNRMIRRLHQEQQMKVDFIATLTHDLKVPLLAEKQTLIYLRNKTYGDINEMQDEVIDVLQSSNQSTLQLVNDMLEVNRYESGRVALMKDLVDMAEVMTQTVAECRSLADHKGVDLRVMVKAEESLAYVDRIELKRVIQNLVSNAIKNTPRGGKINCLIADSEALGYKAIASVGDFSQNTLLEPIWLEGYVLVSIQDTGIGIMEHDLHQLFKRFGAANRGRNPMSTGLGLYNCYQVVEAHEGTIWVETTEGEGTAVSFLLPKRSDIVKERRRRLDRRKSESAYRG